VSEKRSVVAAPYRTAKVLPERIALLLDRDAADLSSDELLELARDATERDGWDLACHQQHVVATTTRRRRSTTRTYHRLASFVSVHMLGTSELTGVGRRLRGRLW